jgi:hypothetical protein
MAFFMDFPLIGMREPLSLKASARVRHDSDAQVHNPVRALKLRNAMPVPPGILHGSRVYNRLGAQPTVSIGVQSVSKLDHRTVVHLTDAGLAGVMHNPLNRPGPARIQTI